MKKIVISLLTVLSALFILTACGNKKADYTEKTAESALNSGKNIEGKTVKFKVDQIDPKSSFGYNLQTGKHLNFVDSKNPNVKKGNTVTVKVKKVTSTLGSWIISYTDLKK